MNSKPLNAKRVALNGILIAFTVIVLFFATVLPTSRLSLYALSSFFVSIVVVEFGIKNGCFFYIASSILALTVIPNKIGLLPYVIFFGAYGLVKFFIERLNKISIEYILKFVFFNISLLLGYFFAKQLFFQNINIKIPWWALVIALEIVFIIYDYVYTLFIQYYKTKIRKIIRM